jgi:hypothetical protein
VGKKKVLLTRLWSGHQAGEVVEEDAPCADSMVRKGYGVPYEEPKRVKQSRPASPKPQSHGPAVETADSTSPAAAETAEVTPRPFGKRGD